MDESKLDLKSIHKDKHYKCITDVKWLALQRRRTRKKVLTLPVPTGAGWAKLGSKLRHLACGVVDLRNQ